MNKYLSENPLLLLQSKYGNLIITSLKLILIKKKNVSLIQTSWNCIAYQFPINVSQENKQNSSPITGFRCSKFKKTAGIFICCFSFF